MSDPKPTPKIEDVPYASVTPIADAVGIPPEIQRSSMLTKRSFAP